MLTLAGLASAALVLYLIGCRIWPVIDRGLGYVCGNEPYGGDQGCGLYFCGEHQVGSHQRCIRCETGQEPFAPTPDVPQWIHHKLTDPSWATWRAENPDWVAQADDPVDDYDGFAPPVVDEPHPEIAAAEERERDHIGEDLEDLAAGFAPDGGGGR